MKLRGFEVMKLGRLEDWKIRGAFADNHKAIPLT